VCKQNWRRLVRAEEDYADNAEGDNARDGHDSGPEDDYRTKVETLTPGVTQIRSVPPE